MIKRLSGEIIESKYVSDPFSFFHSINAYEDNGHVVIDLCCYRDGNIIKGLYAKSLNLAAANKPNESRHCAAQLLRSEARRYVLPIIESRSEIPVNENLNSLTYSRASAIMRRNKTIFCAHEQLTKTGYSMFIHIAIHQFNMMLYFTDTAEMPRINYEKFNGKKYRYFYAITRRDTDFLTQLVSYYVIGSLIS